MAEDPLRGAIQPFRQRHGRILTAALEVFSRSSFGGATTGEIASRAHVSKRDLYADFPDKHAILVAVVEMVLHTGEENIERVVADSSQTVRSLEKKLEIIGLALMSEILSPVTGFVSRLVTSEALEQPRIGALYFDNWYTRRNQLIAQVFSKHVARPNQRPRRPGDASQAAKHYVALVTQLPQLTVSVGMLEMWNQKSIEAHVRNAVERLLKAYPTFV